MREIKFRGMDLQGRWFYGLPTHIQTDKAGAYKRGWYISNSVGMPCAYPVRPETITQYSGITSKNGHQLYEGDIIENDAEWWEIIFSEGKFICSPINGGNVWMDVEELASSQETWLQGNIYEKPDLISSSH
jgi:hypothetical protein